MRRISMSAMLVATSAGWSRAVEPNELIVPAGYSIQKAAGPPAVRFPMFGALDERGRLFVAESSGLDLYEELRKLSRTCRVSVLEDRDGDGVYESIQVFADQLVFPMGLAWHRGRLYVADPPKLIALEDSDQDGRADKRTVILGDFGHLDNGSLHGLLFGPDGWLYLTMGQPDGYKFTRADGSTLSGKSGALIRCRPDGSDVEVISRGFENLVEVDFYATGEIIGTDNWFYSPADGLRDALVHLLEGGLYPSSLRDAGTPMLVSGDPLPSIAGYPAVAFSGLTRYRGTTFPLATGSYFSAQHNTRKIGHHRFERAGTTFRAEDADFMSTDDPDFHPADVLEDADGSLLVLDTGSWYIHHCPTGKIRDVTAEGGIFRVRHTNAAPVTDPRGLTLNWQDISTDALVKRLEDDRVWVQDRALDQLVTRKAEAGPALKRLLSPEAPLRVSEKVVWALSRLPKTTPILLELLQSENPEIAALTARAAGRASLKEAGPGLTRILNHSTPHVALAAAEALANCGGPPLVREMFRAISNANDRLLEHSLIHALYRWASRADLEAALDDPSPKVQKAALILLDQPPHDALTAGAAVARLFAQDADLRKAARAALAKHREWVEPALPSLRQVAYSPDPTTADLTLLREAVSAFYGNTSFVALIAEALTDAARVRPNVHTALLESISRMTGSQVPKPWIASLQTQLNSSDPAVLLQAAKCARALQSPDLDGTLAAVAENPAQPDQLRLEATASIVRRHPHLTPNVCELLLARLDLTNAASIRLSAADILSQSRLTPAQLVRLLESASKDPILTPSLVFHAAKSSAQPVQAGEQLLSYIRTCVEREVLVGADTLEWIGGLLSSSAREELLRFRQLAETREERQRSQLRQLEPLLSGGDPNRGHELFLGKATCATCHRIGQIGGLTGPDLTKIGAVRSGRDLIESLAVPSATFAQGYESYLVTLKNGESISGVRVRSLDETFILREAGGGEFRLDPEQVANLRRSEISLMPEGLINVLSREEVRDLLAFLQSLR